MPDDEAGRADSSIESRRDELILLVEDEGLLRSVTKRFLEEAGFRVVEAEDGAQGIERFKQHAQEIRLILLDFVLPQMDGLSVLTEIRKMRSDVDAIVCSSYLPPGIAQRFLQLGVRRFIEKPYSPLQIITDVHEVLGR